MEASLFTAHGLEWAGSRGDARTNKTSFGLDVGWEKKTGFQDVPSLPKQWKAVGSRVRRASSELCLRCESGDFVVGESIQDPGGTDSV